MDNKRIKELYKEFIYLRNSYVNVIAKQNGSSIYKNPKQIAIKDLKFIFDDFEEFMKEYDESKRTNLVQKAKELIDKTITLMDCRRSNFNYSKFTIILGQYNGDIVFDNLLDSYNVTKENIARLLREDNLLFLEESSISFVDEAFDEIREEQFETKLKSQIEKIEKNELKQNSIVGASVIKEEAIKEKESERKKRWWFSFT